MGLRFSILVPTRQRPDTLLATLATLIWHPGDDYEIVVADNCGDEQVAAVVNAAQQRHPRVRHIRSDSVLPMAVNWERGLAACAGEYISVLGDDDGFLPSTLDIVRNLVAATNCKLIAWDMHSYWWPDTIAYWHRNRLYVSLGNNDIGWINSRAALVATYRDPASVGNLPMVYNGFVHRDIVNAVIGRFGAYFVPPELAPDVASGVINLAFTDQYLFSCRPLAVRGNSRRSTGTSFWARSLGKEQQEIYLKEERTTIEKISHPSMVPARSVAMGVTSLKLFVKDLVFPNDNELQIDRSLIVRHVIATLNNDPEAYDDNLAEALQLAAKIGFTVDPETIPPKSATTPHRRPIQGLYGSGKDLGIGINGDLAGISDVAGAARLAQSMLSAVTVTITRPSEVQEPEKQPDPNPTLAKQVA